MHFVKYDLAKLIFLLKNTPKYLVIPKKVLPLQRNLRESFLKAFFCSYNKRVN